MNTKAEYQHLEKRPDQRSRELFIRGTGIRASTIWHDRYISRFSPAQIARDRDSVLNPKSWTRKWGCLDNNLSYSLLGEPLAFELYRGQIPQGRVYPLLHIHLFQEPANLSIGFPVVLILG